MLELLGTKNDLSTEGFLRIAEGTSLTFQWAAWFNEHMNEMAFPFERRQKG